MPETSAGIDSGIAVGRAEIVISWVTCSSTPPSLTPGASSVPISSIVTSASIFSSSLTSWQVEVDEVVADGVALLLLEHHRDRRRALDLDVEEGAAVDQDTSRTARAWAWNARASLAAAVDDAGHQPLAAQAAALARAEVGARLRFQGRLDRRPCGG